MTSFQLTSILSSTQLGMETVTQQVSELDSKVREVASNQEELTSDVKKVTKKVTELHTLRTQSPKQHRHSAGGHSSGGGGGGHHVCAEVREKVNKIYDRVVSSGIVADATGSDVELSLSQVSS